MKIKKTQELAVRHSCEYRISDKWGKTFNKSAALNEFLDFSDWILLLDADILLPGSFDLPEDKNVLYGAKCRHCLKFENFGKKWSEYPYRGTFYPCNVAGKIKQRLAGYFHLWYGPNKNMLLPPSPDASRYDMLHSLRFDEVSLLSNYEVLHLGETGKNWNGRKTPAWG